MFYNRHVEIAQLRIALERERAQFVVLYGRRRCGKSTLLRRVIDERDAYYLAIQGDSALQRKLFSQSLDERFPGFSLADFSDWNALFEAVIQRGGERFTIVLDEFPYLVKAAGSLPSILQRILEDRTRLNFHLIVCGSSQQMMEDAVLSATAPLYGRADEILKITPLAAGYLADHLPQHSAADLVREYAVWGGVPRYWELRKRSDSLMDSVTELLLRPTGLLLDEPRRLLLDDVRSLTQPISLLTVIAGGANRLVEIGGRLQRSSTDLYRPLERLIALGYVVKEQPFAAPHRSNKQTYYRVGDPFMRFYHRFIIPNVSEIQRGRSATVSQTISTQFDQFVGPTWERLCARAVAAGLVDDAYTDCRRWWGKTTTGRAVELDLVARSTDGRRLLIGECKWTTKTIGPGVKDRLTALVPELPFYRGETIEIVTMSRTGGDFGPAAVLKALR